MKNPIWYNSYDLLRAGLDEKIKKITSRCEELNVNPSTVFNEIRRENIARIVHESNWQEGLYLDEARTRELTEIAFDELSNITGPSVDTKGILERHRSRVIEMKRKGQSVEEIAAYNLSAAHLCLVYLQRQTMLKLMAFSYFQTQKLVNVIKYYEEHGSLQEMGDEEKKEFEESREMIRSLDLTKFTQDKYDDDYDYLGEMEVAINAMKDSKQNLGFPVINIPAMEDKVSRGDYFREILNGGEFTVKTIFPHEYLHFLHNITMMGILPKSKRGCFRKISVHVNDPDVHFPQPSLVPGLAKEFCESIPVMMLRALIGDEIIVAAEASYRFVRIHPYSDGNGRLSRLIMNYFLILRHPPVYLKADKKGRSRYKQALKRANRGDIKPLSALIALYFDKIYDSIIEAIRA